MVGITRRGNVIYLSDGYSDTAFDIELATNPYDPEKYRVKARSESDALEMVMDYKLSKGEQYPFATEDEFNKVFGDDGWMDQCVYVDLGYWISTTAFIITPVEGKGSASRSKRSRSKGPRVSSRSVRSRSTRSDWDEEDEDEDFDVNTLDGMRRYVMREYPWTVPYLEDPEVWGWLRDFLEYAAWLEHGNQPSMSEYATEGYLAEYVVDLVEKANPYETEYLTAQGDYDTIGPREIDLLDRRAAIQRRFGVEPDWKGIPGKGSASKRGGPKGGKPARPRSASSRGKEKSPTKRASAMNGKASRKANGRSSSKSKGGRR